MEHFWCYDKPQANSDSQNSPWPELGGKHHLPPYSILCAYSQGPHPNDILSLNSQKGVLKLSKLGFLGLWSLITLCADLRLKWDLKQTYSHRQELFNNMSHAIYTWGNRVNFSLLVIGSQTTNLILNLSFGHNLCFIYPSGSCEPILDIYVPRSFNDIRNSSIQWVLTPAIALWKSQSGSSLGSVRVHSLTLSYIPESMKCDFRASFLACNLASICLGYEPKFQVATIII